MFFNFLSRDKPYFQALGYSLEGQIEPYITSPHFAQNLKKKLVTRFLQVHGHQKFLSIFEEKRIFDSFGADKLNTSAEANAARDWGSIFMGQLSQKEQDLDYLEQLKGKYMNDARKAVSCGNYLHSSAWWGCFSKKQHDFHDLISHFETRVSPYINNFAQKLPFSEERILTNHFKNLDTLLRNPASNDKWRGCGKTLPTPESVYLAQEDAKYFLIRRACIDCCFDPATNSIMKYRFSISHKFSNTDLWKFLLNIFIFNYSYKKKVKCFKIANTRLGIEHSVTLDKLFGENGYEFFMNTCKKYLFCSFKNWPQDIQLLKKSYVVRKLPMIKIENAKKLADYNKEFLGIK